jgi:hypothetical protein
MDLKKTHANEREEDINDDERGSHPPSRIGPNKERPCQFFHYRSSDANAKHLQILIIKVRNGNTMTPVTQ